jgi:hypothetical protein
MIRNSNDSGPERSGGTTKRLLALPAMGAALLLAACGGGEKAPHYVKNDRVAHVADTYAKLIERIRIANKANAQTVSDENSSETTPNTTPDDNTVTTTTHLTVKTKNGTGAYEFVVAKNENDPSLIEGVSVSAWKVGNEKDSDYGLSISHSETGPITGDNWQVWSNPKSYIESTGIDQIFTTDPNPIDPTIELRLNETKFQAITTQANRVLLSAVAGEPIK